MIWPGKSSISARPSSWALFFYEKTRAAGAEENPQGSAFDRGAGIARTGAGLPLAQGHSGIPQLEQAENQLIPTSCRCKSSTPVASIPPTTRPWRPLVGYRRRIRICRISRFGPAKVVASVKPSWHRRVIKWWRRIIPRSNCELWRTCPATRACWMPLPVAKTSTGLLLRKSLAKPLMT